VKYKPGSPEWWAHAAELEAQDAALPIGWWYLSFATEKAFNGAACVQARGLGGAIRESHRLGINPGGEVMGGKLPPEIVPPAELRHHLVDIETLRRLFPGQMMPWPDEEQTGD